MWKIVFVFLLLLPSLVRVGNATEIKKSKLCSITNKDIKDSNTIQGAVVKYLKILDDINSFSFKGKNITAETAVSLMDEKNVIKRNMNYILLSTKNLNKEKSCAIKEWVYIAHNITNSLRYMDDLERFNLIGECEVCFFDIAGVGLAYENINIKLNATK